jgi:hypothetical protein
LSAQFLVVPVPWQV